MWQKRKPSKEHVDDGHEVIAAEMLPRSLAELELLVARDLDLIRYPTKSWVLAKPAPDGGNAYDVLIVGGGQAGVSAAFGLLRERVANLLVIDENPQTREGPWSTYARMETLRTPKEVGGIDLGLPNLSFRAWFEVQHGSEAWQKLYKIPTHLWHGYLQWYRCVLQLPMRNNCKLIRFEASSSGLIAAQVESEGVRSTIWTRTLVLATGIEGAGIRNTPEFVTSRLPRDRWAHTHDDIDFSQLRGKAIGVLGGAASAFDTAAAAAEAGARVVHLYHRDAEVRALAPLAWTEFNGFLSHYPDLPASHRWRFARELKRYKTGAPVRTVARARALANLLIHPGSLWNDVSFDGTAITLGATDGPLMVDFVILATGYAADLALRPEMVEHLPNIARWKDVFVPRPDEEDAELAAAPFLGPHFEMQEIRPGAAPWLRTVFCFNRGAQMSMGVMPIGLSGIKLGVPRLAHGITRHLFTTDVDEHFEAMCRWQASDSLLES